MGKMYLGIVATALLAGYGRIPDTPADPGTLLWKHEISGPLWSSPAFANGTLFVGSDDGSVTALNTADRTERWRFETSGRIRSAITIAGDLVLAASDDGHLYALDRTTGAERWRADLGSGDLERVVPAITPPYEYDYMHSTPVVADGAVYVGSADGHLYALDLSSGAERWRFATGAKIRSTPRVMDGKVYFGSWDGHVYAIAATDGAEVWRHDMGAVVQGSPAVAAGKVIVGSRSARIKALSADSGEEVWTHVFTDGSWVESSPVVGGERLYIGTSDARQLLSLDLETGKVVWSFETSGWSWSRPALVDGTVYIGAVGAYPYPVTLERGLFAVGAETGDLRWRLVPDPIEGYVTGGVFATPVVADGVVYVASLDGVIYAVEE